MKKPVLNLIFLIPIIARSANPRHHEGLAHQPVAVPTDSMHFLLFGAGILLGCYTIYKKNRLKIKKNTLQ